MIAVRVRLTRILLCVLLAIVIPRSAAAQELEPRRWGHLPTGLNFAGVAYAYTEADISDAPAFRLEDVRLNLHTVAARYTRTFDLLGKSARVDLTQGYQEGRWEGLLDGTPASTTRAGWTDSIARFAVNLYGAPPLSGREYASYRASRDVETIVGAALVVHLPTGEYMPERLINLGSNRFTIRPQIGVVHSRGNWSMELTGAAWFYTRNDDFFGGNTLEQDPFLTMQGHLTYTFRPGSWAGVSGGYGYGAESTVNGVAKNDRKENVAWALSAGYPLSRDWGVKVAYLGTRKRAKDGLDSDTFSLAVAHFW